MGNVSVNIGRAYFDDGQYARSEPFFRYAVSVFEIYLEPDSLKVAEVAFAVGEANRPLKRYDRAVPLSKRSIDIRERALTLTNLEVATALNSLALLYTEQGNYKDTEPRFKLVISIGEFIAAPSLIGTTLDHYAAMLRQAGRASQARSAAVRAKEILKKGP